MNIIWASCYTVMKWGLEYLSPMHFLFLRMSVSLVIMIIISIKQFRRMDKYVILRGAALGAVLAVAHGLGFAGINKSHATDAAILYAIEPVGAIIIARIMLKERMDAWRFSALILTLIGFVILSDVSFKNILSNFTLIGNLLMLVGVLADGFFSPVAKPVVEKYPARLVLTAALFFATLFLLPFALISPVKSPSISWEAVASVLYLSALCTCVGWTLWLYFLSRFPVNVIAITVFIQPVLGAFIPHFTIGEEVSARVWFGGGVILLGVLIAVAKRWRSEDELISEAAIH
ncbi:MAG: DMT family transporter [Deltaproteobacteria bacterium]|nr:DMT family transporter [Deltaproteobacteria bacterium]